MDYITADGGFDFSIDFNKQEDLSIKLIITQILYAIIMQKKNGNFILKIFDVFKLKTVEIIFLLANLYENVYIYKPFTSRIANSEKYIICKNFKSINDNQLNNIINNFSYIINNIDNIKSLLNINFPRIFINKLEEINAIYGQQQIENINSTLNLIRENINIDIYRKQFDIVDSNILINNNKINKNNDSFIELDNISILNYNSLSISPISSSSLSTSPISISPSSTSPLSSSPILTSCISNNINIIYVPNLNDHSNNKQDNISNKINININNSKFKEKIDKFNNKIATLKNINIQKSISWCNKYNFVINKQLIDN